MKLKNHDVSQGDTLIITTPFEAVSDEGKTYEFLIGTRVELENIDPLSPASEVSFRYAAQSYKGDDSYFVTVEHWFHIRNQLKYIEEDQPPKEENKPKETPKTNEHPLLGFLVVMGYMAGIAFVVWVLCGLLGLVMRRL